MYPQSMFWSKSKVKKILLKVFSFYNLRKIYTLHGRVFVMTVLISCEFVAQSHVLSLDNKTNVYK